MILLDTDVFSEVLRERPAPAVLRWLTASPDVEFATATPVLAELLTGVSTMPEGRRRDTVGQAVEEFLVSLSGRIWSFDEPAAVEYAAIVDASARIITSVSWRRC